MPDHIQSIAKEIGTSKKQVTATIALLDSGATVPFIARYRKEHTGGLSDSQLRTLHTRLGYVRKLEARKQTILKSIAKQGRLTDALRQAIVNTDNKNHLEDLYLPYKKKRRTKAQAACEAGLEPLLRALVEHPEKQPKTLASAFIQPAKGIDNPAAALEGACYIALEQLSENAELIQRLRRWLWRHGHIFSRVISGQERAGAAYQDYFDFSEPLKSVPSHRLLAMLRGRHAGYLRLTIDVPGTNRYSTHPAIGKLAAYTGWPAHKSAWLSHTLELAWHSRLSGRLRRQLMNQARETAETEAVTVFSRNLKNLLLAPPAGAQITLGLDPGFRTGVKAALIDTTGQLLDTAVIYPHPPKKQWRQAKILLARMCQKHQVSLIAIGNGTASRETDELVTELLRDTPGIKAQKVTVSEAGASVYSASETAALEFPNLDVSLRGAVSIARRLQDPLAELVKIDPKAIGVGQYQHDVNQQKLAAALNSCVEDCVNTVGVDVNTASVDVLRHVSGITPSVAQAIVDYRSRHGPFRNRQQLKNVPRLGEKTFEQCAGFLRIINGDQPLDQTAIHPEAYPVVESILRRLQYRVSEVLGRDDRLASINPREFISHKYSLPAIKDIIRELKNAGRDPRGKFQTPRFNKTVRNLADLKPGMVLEGRVTNVAAFGAFIDIGVHRDGLVHVSQLPERFVKNPDAVIKVGDVLKVTVLAVDAERKRIDLSAYENAQWESVRKKSARSLTKRKATTQKTTRYNKTTRASLVKGSSVHSHKPGLKKP